MHLFLINVILLAYFKRLVMHIRNEYQKMGVETFYKNNASSYENPHEKIIHSHLRLLIKNKVIKTNDKILDLCCGTGQVSSFLKTNGFKFITGCDPFTNIEYQKRLGLKAYNFDFRNIANGSLSKNKFDVVICSFAMHLCPVSLLPQLLYQLSLISNKLVIVSPHKKPEIKSYWDIDFEHKDNRVYTKVFKTNINKEGL